jgi:hypothetical protein
VLLRNTLSIILKDSFVSQGKLLQINNIIFLKPMQTIRLRSKFPLIGYQNGKAICATGHVSQFVYEMSRLPRFLDNQFTDGGEVESLTRRPLFTSQIGSRYSFLLEAESTPRA